MSAVVATLHRLQARTARPSLAEAIAVFCDTIEACPQGDAWRDFRSR
jgi:hypothetical protein